MTLVFRLANALRVRKVSRCIQNFELLKSSEILFLRCLWVCEWASVASNLIQILPALPLAADFQAELKATLTIVRSRLQQELIRYLRSFCLRMMNYCSRQSCLLQVAKL